MACTRTPLSRSRRRSCATLVPRARLASYMPAVRVMAPRPAPPAASIRGSSGVPMAVPQHKPMAGDSSILGIATPVAHEHDRDMSITYETVRTNGVALNVASAGLGPPVVFCHGFPGLGYSFRHQLPAVAAAGFRALAPDQRGYGGSDRPVDPALYDAEHVMQDMLGILDALGESEAVFVGHDFGAQQVCNLAVRHPARVTAVVIMSCPYDFDLAGRGGAGSAVQAGAGPDGGPFAVPGVRPSAAFAAIARQHFFHMHYFQEIGRPEAELGARPREFLMRLMHALSAQGRLSDWSKFPSEGTGYLDVLAPAPALPWNWLSRGEFEHYVHEYT